MYRPKFFELITRTRYNVEEIPWTLAFGPAVWMPESSYNDKQCNAVEINHPCTECPRPYLTLSTLKSCMDLSPGRCYNFIQ